ncbi:hypothetical protein PQX77_001222 [Marasmius sp. AFHP31]|nr:hypothetical protein PQX77_001222 [Marasmius sp. AFHP31]
MNTLRIHRIRTKVFIRKREDITIEEFGRVWLDNHSKVCWREDGDYQLHVSQAEKHRSIKMGVPVFDYDGVVLFDSESIAAMNTERRLPAPRRTDEDLNIAARMGSASSAYLRPPTKLRKDRSRVIFAFKAKPGIDLSKAWLQGHAEVVKLTPLGESMIKCEQLHLAAPIARSVGTDSSDDRTLKIPR